MDKKAMLIEEAAKYFGYSAFDKDFSKYLLSLGIEEKPVFEENPIISVAKEEQGYELRFCMRSSYDKYHGDPRSAEQMLFSEIFVYGPQNDGEFKPYAERLPYGLTFESILTEAKNIFGEPSMSHPSGPENTVYSWEGIEGKRIAICVLPHDKGITFFTIEPIRL